MLEQTNEILEQSNGILEQTIRMLELTNGMLVETNGMLDPGETLQCSVLSSVWIIDRILS